MVNFGWVIILQVFYLDPISVTFCIFHFFNVKDPIVTLKNEKFQKINVLKKLEFFKNLEVSIHLEIIGTKFMLNI